MIRVERIAPDRTAQRVSIRTHELISDMQAPDGEDAGADPHDLYDAALGACKALTMVWFAQRKKIALEGVDVTIERDLSQMHDGIYKLSVQIAIDGPMTPEERAQVIAVAEKCPVQKLMTNLRTQIETTTL